MRLNYQRKTSRQSWNKDAMAGAIDAVSAGKFGFLKAAETFGVPKTTLERRVKGQNKYAVGKEKALGSRTSTFSPELEQQMIRYIRSMETTFYGLSTTSVRSIAYQMAVKNNIPHPFNQEKELAGLDWLRLFLKRNKLVIRRPEARAFNKESVDVFFNLLESFQERNQFPPGRIFNMDETGISTIPEQPTKVIPCRERKQTGTSSEDGTLLTAVICMNAAGNFIPPMLIFPRSHKNNDFLEGCPSGTLGTFHPSGQMQLHLFEEWFDHFLVHSRASSENPALLILDGQKPYAKNISLIDKAEARGVRLLCLPPRCHHRMQPVDVSFLSPLSAFYTQEVETWRQDHPGRTVTLSQVSTFFGSAYPRASTPINAILGFKNTGIYPIDRSLFNDDVFASSLNPDLPELQQAEVSDGDALDSEETD